MTPRYVVVSGLPGSGKSTLARGLGAALGLPVIDKDDFLEARFPADGTIDRAERARLSRLADDDFVQAATDAPRAVLVSFWRRVELSATSGTPIDWLSALPRAVEVHCTCPVEVAATRFEQRRRHAAHGDATIDGEQLRHQFRSLEPLGPLGGLPLIMVDTTSPVDIAHLAGRVITAWV